MEILTSLLLIVFGILQIILFFKIWGMTNNVKSIKSKYVDTNPEHKDMPRRRFIANQYSAIKMIRGQEAADEYVNSLLIDYITLQLTEHPGESDTIIKNVYSTFGTYLVKDKVNGITDAIKERYLDSYKGIKVGEKVICDSYGTQTTCNKIDIIAEQIEGTYGGRYDLEDVKVPNSSN